MRSYLIDTNIISFALRGSHGVADVLARHRPGSLLLSAVVLAEGRSGAYRSSRAAHWLDGWDRLTRDWMPAPFDAACADHYGRIRADLERRGAMIGHRDCQIAATALAYAAAQAAHVVVVTDNVAEFKRVAGLHVVNWAQGADRG
jgi:tRNA(fMet)-specific endonuclease VapC